MIDTPWSVSSEPEGDSVELETETELEPEPEPEPETEPADSVMFASLLRILWFVNERSEYVSSSETSLSDTNKGISDIRSLSPIVISRLFVTLLIKLSEFAILS